MAGLEAVAGEAVAALVTGVLEKALSYGHEFLGSELNTAVKDLQTKLKAIKDILPNRKQKTSWMDDLKDAAYEAEAVLDEIEYERLRRQVKKFNFPSVFNKNKRSFLLMVREIETKLDKILNTASRVEICKNSKDNTAVQVVSTYNPRETTSFPDSKQLIGRDDVRDRVKNWLLDNSTKPLETLGKSSIAPNPNINEDIPVLPIYGMGGMGKTTLAQHIFNADDVKSRFELTVWVYVSEIFDIKKIMKDIILGSARSCGSGTSQDSEKKNSPRERHPLEVLEQELIKKLTGMRFLIVLDDVWNDKKEAWDKLRKCFECGKQGSKIMVTCRSERVAKLMATPNTKPILLDGLSQEDFWLLFRKHAIGEQVISSEKSQEYEQVGRQIAQKLQGSPLASKTIGRVLQSNLEIEQWTQVLESELWDLEQSDCEIMPALLLSYQHLPDNVKPCFRYMSVLPKGWNISYISVIREWIAHGFVQRLHYRKSLITLGMEYINELLNSSLFEQVEVEGVKHISMHDLIHDMVRMVSNDEIIIVRDNNFAHIPERVQHLSIYPDEGSQMDWMKITSQLNIEYLRSLSIDGRHEKSIHYKNEDFMLFVDKILTEGKNLKLLELNYVGIKEIPSRISNLKFLRNLGLHGNPIRTLPKSIACLYYLQTLDVNNCSKLEILPKEMRSLLNLIHFEGDHTLLDTSCFRKLKSTEALKFQVSCAQDHKIKELSGLDYILWISIQGLENVKSKEEAMEAKLKGKNYLEELSMEWSLDVPSLLARSSDEEVIEGLQPSPQLKYVEVKNYGGVRCPSWFGSRDLPNLCKMRFDNCFALKEIFTSERLPESIQELVLIKCEQLQGTRLLKNDNFFPPNLRSLWIRKCGEFGNCLQWKHVVGLKFLKKLDLEDCVSIEYLPKEELQSLKELGVGECKILSAEKRMGDLQALTSLVELQIRKCDNFIKGLVEPDGATLPSSLQKLVLVLDDYPGEIVFSNLLVHRLDLYHSEKLQSLPIEVLLYVNRLKICDCPNLCPPEVPNGQLELMAGSNIKHFLLSYARADKLKEWLGFLKSSKLIYQLEIENIEELESSFVDELGGLLADMQSLYYLHLKDLKGLQSVPGSLSKHPSLGYLKISKCPKIKSLSGSMFPDSMELEIVDCPKLTKQGLPEKEFIERTPRIYTVKHTTRPAAKALPWHK